MYRSKILWSLAGLFSTPLAAFFFIPLLLSRIDNERFGMIALAWTLLSYASALDLGIGRATTQYVSALRGKGDLAQIPPAIDVAWRLSSPTVPSAWRSSWWRWASTWKASSPTATSARRN